jgi:hypothetical protein
VNAPPNLAGWRVRGNRPPLGGLKIPAVQKTGQPSRWFAQSVGEFENRVLGRLAGAAPADFGQNLAIAMGRPSFAPRDQPLPPVPQRSAPRCGECGQVLFLVAATGRRRLFCRAMCRRQADHRRRRIRRRQVLLAAYRAVLRTPDRGGYAREPLRRAIREIKAELFVLESQRRP